MNLRGLALASVCVALAVLGACATSPTAPGAATPATDVVASSALRPDSNRGMVVIRRDSGLMGVACGHAVRLDGKLVGELDAGEQVIAYAVPGEHQIDASTTGLFCSVGHVGGASFRIEAGQIKTFRTGFSGLNFRLLVEHVGTEVPIKPASDRPSVGGEVITAKPKPQPAGRYSFEAEKVAKQCAVQPQAILAGRGAGFEAYTVKCDNGDALAIRCEFGSCRVLR